MQNTIVQHTAKKKCLQLSMPKLTMFNYLLLLALSACNGGNSQGGIPSGNIQIDKAATVPVIAGKATTTVIYIHNSSDYEINNISYTTNDNLAKSAKDKFSINSKSCNSIAAHGSCALEFTSPQLSAKDGNVQGSTLLRANFMLDGKASYSQQLINYSLLPTRDGLNISSDIGLQAKQHGMIYFYAESGNYNLETIQSDNRQIKESSRSSQSLSAPQVVAVELVASDIDETQNIRLNLDYQNQITESTVSSQFGVNVSPASNGAILTSGQVPIINTSQSTSGKMLVYNSGNQAATLGNITGSNGITISNSGNSPCLSNTTTLAAGSSCTVYFTVPQTGNTGTITVRYGSSQLAQSATWYNSLNNVLLQMTVSPATVSFNQNTTSPPLTVSVINIGGYDLTGMNIPAATNADGGSATATISTGLSCKDSSNNSTGTNLPVGGSCAYAVTLTETVVEANKSMLLKIGGSYTGSSGSATYQRGTTISYTSIMVPTITITSLTGFSPTSMMGTTPISFTATITGTGSSTLTAALANSVTGTIVSNPNPCTLTVGGTSSCTFSIIPWYTGFDNSTVSLTNYDPFTPAGTSINLSATSSPIITGSNVTNGVINYQISTPYVYLPAPMEGAASESNTGITWGSGGAVNPRFVVGKGPTGATCTSGQEIESDLLTGLTWVKAPSSNTYTWANAKIAPAIPASYCGYTDWRLPTVNEILSLANFTAPGALTPAAWLTTQGFTNVPSEAWSSNASTGGNILVMVFTDNARVAGRSQSSPDPVWPVRGGI